MQSRTPGRLLAFGYCYHTSPGFQHQRCPSLSYVEYVDIDLGNLHENYPSGVPTASLGSRLSTTKRWDYPVLMLPNPILQYMFLGTLLTLSIFHKQAGCVVNAPFILLEGCFFLSFYGNSEISRCYSLP